MPAGRAPVNRAGRFHPNPIKAKPHFKLETHGDFGKHRAMISPATFEGFTAELQRLVKRFQEGLHEFSKPQYAEAQLRDDFLNPFFKALGWDLENRTGLIQQKREVEIESRTLIRGQNKRADYLFRADGRDRFICEAKKPAEDMGQARHAYQAKRYAWNKDLPLALLTDFEEFRVFVVGGRPHPEEPEEGVFRTWRFTEYIEKAREIWGLFSRVAVGGGSLDRLLESLPKKPGGKGRDRQLWLIKPDRTRSLDQDFLEFLDEARRTLAGDIYKNNDHEFLAEENRLNEAVQRILDRILFLRICEDREIDTGARLRSIIDTWRKGDETREHVGRKYRQKSLGLQTGETPADAYKTTSGAPHDSLWKAVVRHFRALDRRPPSHVPFFNGNLFRQHFIEDLHVSDQWIAEFVTDLSDDESPYLFNVIPVEILGSVYERFLGKVVRPHGRGVLIEEKPEVRKAGGVYYTPRAIVDYIVEQAVGRPLDDIAAENGVATGWKEFEEKSHSMRILDPACGSGSFLIRALERVCEHWQAWLTRDYRKLQGGKECDAWKNKHRSLCWVDEETGDIHLTVDLKRKILTRNIYGVDLDAAAVEVTQLSLYLKMLENENRTTMQRERDLFKPGAPVLPPLNDNIKCGNSLISSDFSMIPEDILSLKAFDWPVQFENIMKASGFDAIIGNPPYLNIDDTWGKGSLQLEAIRTQYPEIYNDKTDLLFYFVAKVLKLGKAKAGLIVSRAFLEAYKADKLRRHLADSNAVSEIIDFQNHLVFDGVGITTCILMLDRVSDAKNVRAYKLKSRVLPPGELGESLRDTSLFDCHILRKTELTGQPWIFTSKAVAGVIGKIDSHSVALGGMLKIGQGMQTGCNDVFGCLTPMEIKDWKIPRELYRFRASNSDIQRYWIRDRREVLLWVEETQDFEDLPVQLQRHFRDHGAKLKARAAYKRGNCQWWKFTWPLHRELYRSTRLVCPYLATENRFAMVDDNKYVGLTDTTVLFDNGQPESMKYLLGLLNSRLLTFRFRQIAKLKGNGIYEYFWNSVSKLPIRRVNFDDPREKARHDAIVALVDKMLVLTPKSNAAETDSEKAAFDNAVKATSQKIDDLVYETYDLTRDEIELVENETASK